MPMNETKAESKFVKMTKDHGGMALKLRHRFMSGLPDLYVKHNLHEGLFVECKYEPWPKKKEYLDLNLSPLQREFLKRAHDMGQPAVWALFTNRPYTVRTTRLCVVFGADPKTKQVHRGDFMDRDESAPFIRCWDVNDDADHFVLSNMFRSMLKIARSY